MNTSNPGNGILFIISAPSGAGKTTLVKAITEKDPRIVVSISHTTRPRRSMEVDGNSYHFIEELTFNKMVDENMFLEHARVFGNSYGTSRKAVDEQIAAGNDVILEIDWQGAQQLRQTRSDTVSIFVLPPSLEALQERLINRGDSKAIIKQRMLDAELELSHYKEYDFLIVNSVFKVALADLEGVVKTMRHGYPIRKSFFDQFMQQIIEPMSNIK